MARKKKDEDVIECPSPFATPAKNVVKAPRKKKVARRMKDTDAHIFYVRSNKKIFGLISGMASQNKVSINEITSTVLENFFLSPKGYFKMKEENLV
jgi:hypothetical protein